VTDAVKRRTSSSQDVVSFFDYVRFAEWKCSETKHAIERVIARGAFILQEEVSELESAIAERAGVRHAIGVGNCTDGLEIAYRAVGLKSGDDFLVPSHTFVATASAGVAIGARPILVDCGSDHLIDSLALEALLTEATRMIVPVHLNGRLVEPRHIETLAAQHNLEIVSDAAQSLGARLGERRAGSLGRASVISFYPAKLVGAYGDAGMVLTDDDSVAEAVRSMRDHGRGPSGHVVRWGRNSRLDTLQAAVLLVHLKSLDAMIERRREIASHYNDALGRLDGITLPPPPEKGDRFDVYQNYEIESTDRGALRAALSEAGIGTALPWGGFALHQIDGLALGGNLPATDHVFRQVLLLPMHHLLQDEEVEQVCEAVLHHEGSV
jgi:dTDP-4-amino-4,6-dideoxygalactose transaminase